MRFLLDENVPRGLAAALSALGHDVLELPPELRAAEDADVLAAAARDGRVLVTLDTDFGTLVYLQLQAPPPAVASSGCGRSSWPPGFPRSPRPWRRRRPRPACSW